ncbi:translation-associated GTPase [mine drainage metagenome]|uniref:Translation-associated GTPase n=1 Tax=mine drainage metagenome TaxID=410659 RepID=T1B5Y8_9ZZZZ
MIIGIIGAPNKGKSTLFSAMTLNDVGIADYPFTTIDPNMGVAYVKVPCAETLIGIKCNARSGSCSNGVRSIPINIIDVAGLVKDAHLGKGMGNKFLNDLAGADALILVVDASGGTDPNGNPCDSCNPYDDISMVMAELQAWLYGILKKHMNTISKNEDGTQALYNVLAGLKVSSNDIEESAKECFLSTSRINWSDEDIMAFSKALLKRSKPILIAANKVDKPGAQDNVSRLKKELGEDDIIACSAAIELALAKASRGGLISYDGGDSFKTINESMTKEQKDALKYMSEFIKVNGGSGVQRILNTLVFKLLGLIVVYPVEDENKYTDHNGNILPDAILLREGSTALDLARAIHTDIAKGMLYAIDAVKKIRVAKDYVLKNMI